MVLPFLFYGLLRPTTGLLPANCDKLRALAGQIEPRVGEGIMNKKLLAVLGFVPAAAMCVFAADSTMTGYISDSHCGAKGAKPGHEQCAVKCVKENGGKYVFVNDADHKVYAIDNQDKVAQHGGHHVTVRGTVDGDNLKVSSVEMAK